MKFRMSTANVAASSIIIWAVTPILAHGTTYGLVVTQLALAWLVIEAWGLAGQAKRQPRRTLLALAHVLRVSAVKGMIEKGGITVLARSCIIPGIWPSKKGAVGMSGKSIGSAGAVR